MGLFDRALDGAAFARAYSARGLDDPTMTFSEALDAMDVGYETTSGVNVSPEGALKYIAVYSAVRYIAESIGSLPFPLYRREGRSRIRVDETEDIRAYLLNDEPNPYQTAEIFWTTIIGHANLWGNGYAYVERNRKTGAVTGLWPLDPRSTAPYRTDDGRLYYGLATGNGPASLPHTDVIHIRAFGTGDVGISPIGVARQAVGEQLAAEEYAGRFWSNDAKPGGVIQYSKKLSDDQHKDAVKRWNSLHQGLRRKHLVAVLDNGAEWKDVGMPAKDAQFLETRKWGYRQTASLYRVPPHKIGDLEGNVTFASIDAQNLDAVIDCLRPWTVRVEQAVKKTMFPPFVSVESGTLTPDGVKRIYPQVNLAGLLRGDFKTRMEGYALGRQWGWWSIDDIRELEDLPAIGPEKGGDIYLQPLNMVPAGTDPESLATAAASAREFIASLGVQGGPEQTKTTPRA